MDHEPLSGSGATQPHRARYPLQTDTATSNATPHKAAQHGDAADTAALAEEEEAQHMQDKLGSVSRGRTPHEHEEVPDFETARMSVAGAASAPARPALRQQQRQQLLQLASDSGQQELVAHSGSELQQGHEGLDQGAEAMEAEGPGVAPAGQEPAKGSTGQPPAAAAAVKAEDTGMNLGDAPEHAPQQQQQRQQQPSPASRLRQQLDLRDSGAASGDSGAGRGPQQQQQVKQQLGATDLHAAMFSAAAAAAAAAAQTAGPSAAAAAHGPTAVSPYVQGLSAAAAAANAGLNLADSPQVRAAVEQEEPHPGAQLPEAAAAALAATPATGGRTGAAAEHRVSCRCSCIVLLFAHKA